MRLVSAKWRADVLACLILLALWGGFFWRFLTPVEADQVSLVEGDFSGQFVAFGAYQAARLWAGEVPLWNPYNNGGLPFIADTQAAVFYPPRLLTIALTGLSREWSYHALELEMMAHVLLTSLLMYGLIRWLTAGASGSVTGALIGAIVWAYGGFMTGYPPLQLALLEAVSWGPLILLGVHGATAREQPRAAWLLISGLGLGLSVLAGHPQTNWFLGWLAAAFLAWRVYRRRWPWTAFLTGGALLALLAAALAAVQLLPAVEYLQHTTRLAYGFEARRNGFPIQDVIQIVFPRVLSVWSPLYAGIVGLILAAIALWERTRDRVFWGGAALFALLFSFGGNAALYGLLVNLWPGLNLFRGQERAAMVFALALSILAGQGACYLFSLDPAQARGIRAALWRGLLLLGVLTGFVTMVAFVLWLGETTGFDANRLGALAFSALVAWLAVAAMLWLLRAPGDRLRQGAVVALLVFDLFTVAGDNLLTEPVPPDRRLARPAILQVALDDPAVPPQRVDGQRGVLANYGTLWQIPDIRGISPLWLDGPYAVIGQTFPNPLAWELFAVRYVFTDWQELPVPSTVIAQGADAYGPINAHLLADPRPFALLMDDVWRVDGDANARAVLAEPGLNPRRTIVLDVGGGVALPEVLRANGTAMVTSFTPESITIAVRDNPDPAVLSLALPHYPGWQAFVDGQPAPLLRAYGALSALVLPGGVAEVRLVYDPWTFKAGALISVVSWLGLALAGLWQFWRWRRREGRV